MAHHHLNDKLKNLKELGTTWWGKSWIKNMLQYGRFYRLQRAITYTKENRVSNVIIQKGEVFALCQGTAPTPYRVRIEFTPIVPAQWDKVIAEMGESIFVESKLLSGEMPKHINKLFLRNGVPLFPVPKQNLDATCNCPDEAIPCKHISAVVLTLASIFDYDPFMLFKLRGMTREELLMALRNLSVNNSPEGEEKSDSTPKSQNKIIIRNFQTPDLARIRPIEFDIGIIESDESVFHQLGSPTEVSDAKFTSIMETIYRDASKYANELIYQSKPKKSKTTQGKQ
jgi:uncharacterized Zn finger protein